MIFFKYSMAKIEQYDVVETKNQRKLLQMKIIIVCCCQTVLKFKPANLIETPSECIEHMIFYSWIFQKYIFDWPFVLSSHTRGI